MSTIRSLALAFSCASVLGCAQHSSLLDLDAGPDPDGALDDAAADGGGEHDAGSDAGPRVTYGTECAEDAECTPLCEGEDSSCVAVCSSVGQCATACGLVSPCPIEGSICLARTGGDFTCQLPCDPAEPDPCAPRGMGCAYTGDGFAFCDVGCTDDHDCDDGRLCQRNSNGGICLRTTARIGDPCEVRTDRQSDCNDQALCMVPAEGATSGICAERGCSTTSHCAGQDGTVCARFQSGAFELVACVPECVDDSDCAAGFVCVDASGGGRGCVPPPVAEI